MLVISLQKEYSEANQGKMQGVCFAEKLWLVFLKERISEMNSIQSKMVMQ